MNVALQKSIASDSRLSVISELGGLMKVNWALSTVVVLCLSNANTSADRLSQANETRSTLNDLLKRIEDGRNPCFTDACQSQKLNLLGEIYRKTENLSGIGSHILKSRNRGTQSGYDLLTHPFHPNNRPEIFPNSMSDWAYYWKERVTHETRLKSEWMHFFAETYALNDGLTIYSKLASQSLPQRTLIQEAWNRGAGDIAFMMAQSALLSEQASTLRAQGRDQDSEKLLQSALQLSSRRERLEENFKGQFRNLLESFLPSVSFKEIVSLFAFLKVDSDQTGESLIFSDANRSRLLSKAKSIRNLARQVQEFTDLEYGVVGIRNFYSRVNPAVQVESALPVQEFLDRVVSQAQSLVELGVSYFLMKAGGIFFESKFLSNTTLPAAYAFLSLDKGWGLGTLLIPDSNRSHRLEQSLPALEEQMERRLVELLKTKNLLQRKILETETQILHLKQREEESP